ncbi:MAG: TIGR04086 family membrane protein [Lachnospiraceae bacterium]
MKQKKMVALLVKDLFLMYALTGICLILLTFLLYRYEISTSILSGGMTMTYLLSGFAGGFLLGKNAQSRRFLWGLLAGILYFAGIFLMSAALQHGFPQNLRSTILTAVLCILAGMTGGMTSSMGK